MEEDETLETDPLHFAVDWFVDFDGLSQYIKFISKR